MADLNKFDLFKNDKREVQVLGNRGIQLGNVVKLVCKLKGSENLFPRNAHLAKLSRRILAREETKNPTVTLTELPGYQQENKSDPQHPEPPLQTVTQTSL